MVNRLVFLAGLSITAGLDTPILSHKVRNLINSEGDDYCPYADAAEERLLYNIDIQVQGLDGCGDDDLLNVGAIIQQVVKEVEAEIPEYKNENMQTTICLKPVIEPATRRGLRLAQSSRELQNTRRYVYKGGGKCRRCRRNNNDRRLLQEAVSYEMTCLNTDKDIYDADVADLAEAAVEAVGDAVLDLKEAALICANLKDGKPLVTWAKETLEKCKAAQKESQDAVARARALCQQAILASSEAQTATLVQQAAASFNTAMKAIDKIQQLHSEMQDKLETTAVCDYVEDTSVEGASSSAEMATYLAEISAFAAMKTKEGFSQLRERATECGRTQLIDRARTQLVACRKAKKAAVRNATISRRNAQQVRAATTQEELKQGAKMAEKSSEQAFLAAKRARDSYFLIKDELRRPICGETEIPKEDEGTPLKQWLARLMDMLYERIPERIFNVFLDCSNDGISIDISIDALEEWWETKGLITEKDCDNLSDTSGQ